MAKSCCGQGTCSCLIQAGDGIIVTGSGSDTDPYMIELDTSTFSPTLSVEDTPTVNLTLLGTGTPADPYSLRADSALRVMDLTDVDPIAPNAGDVLSWNIGEQKWKAAPAPANPSGSVNTTGGIAGTGAAGTPILLNVSGAWGTAPLTGVNDLSGLVVYVDSNGQVRAQPVDWSVIQGKPTAFPPSAHTHVAGDITDPEDLRVGGFASAQAAGGVTGPFPVKIGTTEDTTWPNGTVWLQPQL